MGGARDFAERYREAASRFEKIARQSGLRRIVYLGGLGRDGAELSHHLRSRHEVGDVLRSGGTQVVEYRAAMIIGSGSISFEMLRYLTERLPVMIAPRWVTTRAQPIAIGDVYGIWWRLCSSRGSESVIYEIGGADVLTYQDMMQRYARLRNLKRKVIVVPFFSPRLSSYWVHLVTPVSARLAQPLILGLYNEVVVRDDAAARDFPKSSRSASRPRSRVHWTDIAPSARRRPGSTRFDVRKLPVEFSGVREGMLIDRRECISKATPRQIASVFTQLGGKRGWLYGDRLWKLRGLLDRMVGGIGLRRGRRSATELRLGDAIDFWRVDAYEPDRLLRLRAEMRLPGKAWLSSTPSS